MRWAALASIAVGLVLAAVAYALPTGRSGRVEVAASDQFRFLQTLPDGSPERWNPCQPIHYVVNLDGAPVGALVDVTEVVRQISAATGIRFVYDGPSSTTVEHQIFVRSQGGPAVGGWMPLLFAWADDTYLKTLAPSPGVLGVGMPQVGDGALANEYVSGIVAVNSSALIPTGFGFRYSLGPVLLHELSHVMGLGHVQTSGGQIMSVGDTAELSTSSLQPGDLQGLRLVGRASGCLPARPSP